MVRCGDNVSACVGQGRGNRTMVQLVAEIEQGKAVEWVQQISMSGGSCLGGLRLREQVGDQFPVSNKKTCPFVPSYFMFQVL